MKTSFKLLAAIVTGLCFAASLFAADASLAGTWKWTVQGRQGGQGFEQSLKLDVKDGQVSGTLLGRQGGQFPVPDTPISDVSLKDGALKFTVTREFQGRTFTTKYEGKLEGDTLRGTFERPGFGGGEPVKSEWLAKRQK